MRGLEGILFRVYNGQESYLEVNSSSAIGYKMGWNHLVVVIPDTQNYADIYLNGIKQSTNKVGGGFTSFSSNEAFVGMRVNCSNFHGAMDELKFYSHPLSEAEIQVLYHSTFSPILRMVPSTTPPWVQRQLSRRRIILLPPMAEGLPDGCLNVYRSITDGYSARLSSYS